MPRSLRPTSFFWSSLWVFMWVTVAHHAWAQGPSARTSPPPTLSGRVLDAARQPVPGAMVLLLHWPDSTVRGATTTGPDGTFEITRPDTVSRYRLRVQSAGLAGRTLRLPAQAERLAEPVVLEEAPVGLGEVIVTGEKPMIEQLADRVVLNVESTPSAVGLTGLELMRRAPGVIVDQNENLIVRGRQGVRVYINGRPSPLEGQALTDYLKSLNAAEIEAIEVITNPGARFEAAGSAGIINIRLRRGRGAGFNGSLNATTGHSEVNPRSQGSATLNYRKGRMTAYGTVGGAVMRTWNFMQSRVGLADSVYNKSSRNRGSAENVNVNTGIDYELSREHTLSVNVTGGRNEGRSQDRSLTDIYAERPDAPITRQMLALADRKVSTYNVMASVAHRWEDSAKRTLLTEVSAAQFDRRPSVLQPNRYLVPGAERPLYEINYRFWQPSTVGLYVAKIDWEQPLKLWPGGRLSAGTRYNLSTTDNTLDYFDELPPGTPVLNLQQSNRFRYREHIMAAYALVQGGQGRWQWQGGLRAEQTLGSGALAYRTGRRDSTLERQYLNFFPSGSIGYKISAAHQLQLSASRRIDRPAFESLNPFEFRTSDLQSRRGNPFLTPQFSELFELTHTFGGRITTTLSHARVHDIFANIQDTVDARRVFMQQRNLASQRVWTLSVAAPVQILPWWQSFVNVQGFRDQYRGSFPGGVRIDGAAWVATAYMQHNLRLGNGWAGDINGYYSSPGFWGGAWRTRKFWALNLGVQKSIYNDRGMLKLAVMDVFWGQRWYAVADFGNVRDRANGGWDSRMVQASLTWRLGQLNQNQPRRPRRTALDDMSQRVGGGGGGGMGQ